LSKYAKDFTFSSFVMQNPAQLNEKEFPLRLMSLAETLAEIGTYRLFSHVRDEAQTAIEQALHEDPELALAHETRGFLDLADGKDEDARAEFQKAYAKDSQRYLSLYYAAMLSSLQKSALAPDQLAVSNAMYDVLKVNPRFAPALVELAFILARQGSYLNSLKLALTAEESEPSRAGYHLLVGRILLALGRKEEAAKRAAFVAERWRGPDHDEAMELAYAVSGAAHPVETTLPEGQNGMKSWQGTLLSISCEGQNGTSVVIQNDTDGARKFRSKGAYIIGFSDTLWFGADHFTPCHHLEGLRAIIRYKPAADNPSEGEWTELLIREDLPRPPQRGDAIPATAKN
jgi:hypothetical protein